MRNIFYGNATSEQKRSHAGPKLLAAVLWMMAGFSSRAVAAEPAKPTPEAGESKPAVSAEAKEAMRIKSWEPSIKKFEDEDKKSPPPPGGVVFVGSSSIRRWDLDKSFPDLPAVNRGFGGSQLIDSAVYAPRIVVPYRPRLVVLYAGDNDLAANKTPEQVASDLQKFVRTVKAALPETKIVYLGIKPSIKRWANIANIRDANRRMREWTVTQPNVAFVDVDGPMLNSAGEPNPELYVSDGLHLSEKGYLVWRDLLAPHLKP